MQFAEIAAGESALDLASRFGRTAVAQALMAAGADNDADGQAAAGSGHTDSEASVVLPGSESTTAAALRTGQEEAGGVSEDPAAGSGHSVAL